MSISQQLKLTKITTHYPTINQLPLCTLYKQLRSTVAQSTSISLIACATDRYKCLVSSRNDWQAIDQN